MTWSNIKAGMMFSLASLAGVSGADVLTVPGTHATIGDALTAASAGDIIELTDNTSPYLGNLYVTKDNVTIRGQAGLTPAPLIQGVSAAHPLAGQGPQKWYWQAGDPTSSNIWFDTHGAAIVNDADGLTLRDLRISSDPAQSRPVSGTNYTAGVLDFRFGTGGRVENVLINSAGPGAIGAERQVMTANNHVFSNVVFENGRIPLEHQGGTGTLEITSCSLTGQVHIMWVNGGSVTVTDSLLQETSNSNNSLGCILSHEYAASDTSFNRCIFRKPSGTGTGSGFVQLRMPSRGAAAGADDFNSGRYSPLGIEAQFDHCDFVGGPTNHINRVVSLDTGRTSWVAKTLRFTNCNFYNIHGSTFTVADFPFPGNDYKLGGTPDRFEDYNVFKLAQNVAPAVGMVSGGHSVVLAGEPLYVDAAGGDFRLASNSPAATLKGAATPAYTGAVGVSNTSIPVNKLTVGHTGATYTSINAAIAAATDGSLIEITDNSAPYVEDVYLGNLNGITLQGAASLSPRPVIRAGNTTTTVMRLASVSRNVTLKNLVIDGANVTGVDAAALDIRDAGDSVLENVAILGGAGLARTVFSQALRILKNCTVTSTANVPAYHQNVSNPVRLENCLVESVGSALVLDGGMFQVENSTVKGSGAETVALGFTGRSSYFEANNSIITSDAAGAAGAANTLIFARNVNGRRTVVIDNSDLVGSLQAVGAGLSPTGTGIYVEGTGATKYPMTFMKVTDSIFHNIATRAIFMDDNTSTNTIPGLQFVPTVEGVENYNAFKWAPRTLAAQGVPDGANSITLADGDLLYVDAPTDFRLRPTSPAATLNSTGTPAYAGSQGIGPSSVGDWSMYQ